MTMAYAHGTDMTLSVLTPASHALGSVGLTQAPHVAMLERVSSNLVTCFLWKVPAEPVCTDVPGPPVPGHQPDLHAAVCGPHPALHVR